MGSFAGPWPTGQEGAAPSDRTRRPRIVHVVLQLIFVCETIEGAGRRVLRNGADDQHSLPAATGTHAPCSAEDAFAVLPRHVGASVAITGAPRGSAHLPTPRTGQWPPSGEEGAS